MLPSLPLGTGVLLGRYAQQMKKEKETQRQRQQEATRDPGSSVQEAEGKGKQMLFEAPGVTFR